MKIKTIYILMACVAMLTSCGGGKRGGMPNFGDNEYPVVTAQSQSTSLQTTRNSHGLHWRVFFGKMKRM